MEKIMFETILYCSTYFRCLIFLVHIPRHILILKTVLLHENKNYLLQRERAQVSDFTAASCPKNRLEQDKIKEKNSLESLESYLGFTFSMKNSSAVVLLFDLEILK